jgi:hypothetical protein
MNNARMEQPFLNSTQGTAYCSACSKLNTEIGLHTTTTNFWTTYWQHTKLKFGMQPHFNPNKVKIKKRYSMVSIDTDDFLIWLFICLQL